MDLKKLALFPTSHINRCASGEDMAQHKILRVAEACMLVSQEKMKSYFKS